MYITISVRSPQIRQHRHVRPLVIVPGNNFESCRVQHDSCGAIDDARLLPAKEVMRDELVIADSNDVAEGSSRRVGQAASGCVTQRFKQSLLAGDGHGQGDGEVDHRHVVDRYANGDACKG